MDKDFEILRCGSEVRIQGVGKTQAEALASLAKGFAVYQLPLNDVLVAGGQDREIEIGYSQEEYLPSDFLNDIIILEKENKEIYPEVKNIFLNNGVLKAKLFGVKKNPRVVPKSAIYIGSKFKQENNCWLAESEICV